MVETETHFTNCGHLGRNILAPLHGNNNVTQNKTASYLLTLITVNKNYKNAKATKSNATRDSVNTIHKDTLTNLLNTFQINQQQPAKGSGWCDNAHIQPI